MSALVPGLDHTQVINSMAVQTKATPDWTVITMLIDAAYDPRWISYPCYQHHGHSEPMVHDLTPYAHPDEVLVAHAEVCRRARLGEIEPGSPP